MMKERKKLLFAVLFFAVALCSLCGTASFARAAEKEDRLKVFATIYPPYDFAKAVAGDRADISMIIKPGLEAHSYEPTPAAIIALRNADLLLCVGGHADGWVERLETSLAGSRVQIVKLTEGLVLLPEEHDHDEDHADSDHDGHDHDDHDHELDTHVWTSPAMAIEMVHLTADAFCSADPAHADEYRANAAKYAAQIRALDAQYRDAVKSAARREIVFGDRFPFRYLALRYGIKYKAAFDGCDAHSDTSPARVASLINEIRREKLPVVFATEAKNPNIARTISEQAGVPIVVMHSLHNLSPQEFKAGENYLTIMAKNLESLKKGLN